MAGSPPLAHTRFLALPAWVLLTQLFLALGWLRAALAHALDTDWWRGVELQQFLAANSSMTLPMYELFISEVVDPAPALVSIVVLVAEVGVGLALVSDYRPTMALAIGMFLNVHFVAAGAVNPSVFYLIIGLGLLVWHQERRITASESRRIARLVSILATATSLLLAPQISTIAPADVIEDPAAILIFLAWLVALAFWSISAGADERDHETASGSAVVSTPPVMAGAPGFVDHPPNGTARASRLTDGLPFRVPVPVPEPERMRNLARLGHGESAEVDNGRSVLRGLPSLLR